MGILAAARDVIESKDVMHEPSLPVDEQSGAGEIAHPTPKIQRVLVIEDDRRSAVLMKSILDGLARVVVVAGTAMAALDALGESEFDLITLDIGLPDMSGIELIPNIRAMTDAPIIMVTANSQMPSLVEALELGADDYLIKPVRPAELRSRIRAITRRTGPRAHELSEYVDQHVRIDFARATVTNASSSTVLSATERHLLHELVSNRGRVLTSDEIIKRVWGAGYEGTVANLQVFISYLRRKVRAADGSHQYIVTHRGIGYEFVPALSEDVATSAGMALV